MILVDTSVWIDHFRSDSPKLRAALEEGQVLVHPFVVGELACGNIRNGAEILRLLERLPPAAVAEDREVMTLITGRRLCGLGIGWVDAHLLSAALLSRATLWTLDRPLAKVARALGIA